MFGREDRRSEDCLLFPSTLAASPSSFLSFALTCKTASEVILPIAYQHVVVKTESQLEGLLEAPSDERILRLYEKARRCDILLPFSVSKIGVRRLISRYESLPEQVDNTLTLYD